MTESDRAFTSLGGRSIYKGRVIDVRVERFRYADGEEAEREIVHHQGAAAVVAVDDEHVWLVRQPREPVDDPDSLELPAGRLDVDGEPPLDAAKRELAEEIGKQSPRWSPLTTYRSSAGFTDEVVHVFLAEDVRDMPGAKPEAEENERIETVPWPLDELDDLVDQVSDAKTLIGLLLLQRRRAGG